MVGVMVIFPWYVPAVVGPAPILTAMVCGVALPGSTVSQPPPVCVVTEVVKLMTGPFTLSAVTY